MGTELIDHRHFSPHRKCFSSKWNSHSTECFVATQSFLLTKRIHYLRSTLHRKMKFSIEDFLCKCHQIRRKLQENLVTASAFPHGFKRTVNVLRVICWKYVSALICYDKYRSFRKGINNILHDMVYSSIVVNNIHIFKS